MIDQGVVSEDAATVDSSPPDSTANRPGMISFLVLSAWCGLVAGLFEVGAIVLRKQVFDSDRLYKMSRHFVWLIPLSNMAVFLALGLLGCGVMLAWPRRGRRLFSRALCAITLLPALLVAFPWIHGMALLMVAMGIASRIVPRFERDRGMLRRCVLAGGFPAAIAIVASLWAYQWVGDRIEQAREDARPSPPGAPNVLLIVMDTVAAGHLSLHGYDRATGTTLAELAGRGIRFDSARAASSWTLPSHATMFTGRWLHELSVGWATPLDRTYPTLAEFLGGRGYATAGFVANTYYCATDSGLARGFTHYRDFIFPELTALKTAALVNRALEGLQVVVYFSEDWLEAAGLLTVVQRVWRALDTDRKAASAVNREFLDWHSRRGRSQRPFFAFLNYYDAHYPYRLPPRRLHRFGVEPTDNYQRLLIENWWELDKTTVSPAGVAFAATAYDDCIADLDEQLGRLVDELDRRGVLEHSWLIIASDHGESFGEHAGIFCHGKSLYESELHVPLLVIPPGGGATGKTVPETVSLRDLPATIVDVTGLGVGAPFPGSSLARFWERPSRTASLRAVSASPALAEVVPNDPGNRDPWGVPRPLPPLRAVKGNDWSFIRRDGDIREELFDLRKDPKERRNLAGDPANRATLQQLRAALDLLTGGPLSARRLSR